MIFPECTRRSSHRYSFCEDNNYEKFKVGYFDIAPDIDEVTFMGAWSSYMHPSGTIAVTRYFCLRSNFTTYLYSIERGLFFLNFTEAFVEPSRYSWRQAFFH